MAKSINIYKGNIYRVFTNDIKLVNGIVVPEIEDEIISKDAEFYTFFSTYVKLKDGNILVERDEACDFVYSMLDKNNDVLMDYLTSKRVTSRDKKEFLDYLKHLTCCSYIVPHEINRDHVISKSEFKQLKKRIKEERKKNF